MKFLIISLIHRRRFDFTKNSQIIIEKQIEIGYKLFMTNLKKFHVLLAYFISFIILSSSYIPAIEMYGIFSGNMEKVYKTTGLCEYYNLIVALPVKIVNKFVANAVGTNLSEKKSPDSKKENNKKSRNNHFDTVFVKVSENKDAASFGDHNTFISFAKDYESKPAYHNFFHLALFYFIVIMFLWTRTLARGDTEIYNKNINMQKFRLG